MNSMASQSNDSGNRGDRRFTKNGNKTQPEYSLPGHIMSSIASDLNSIRSFNAAIVTNEPAFQNSIHSVAQSDIHFVPRNFPVTETQRCNGNQANEGEIDHNLERVQSERSFRREMDCFLDRCYSSKEVVNFELDRLHLNASSSSKKKSSAQVPYKVERSKAPLMPPTRASREDTLDVICNFNVACHGGKTERFDAKENADGLDCGGRNDEPTFKEIQEEEENKELTIEISPGIHKRFRGSKEAMAAVAQDFYVPCECMCCNQTIFCIQDADFVLCPECRVIGSLDSSKTEQGDGGVGLGFTFEDLAAWQAHHTSI